MGKFSIIATVDSFLGIFCDGPMQFWDVIKWFVSIVVSSIPSLVSLLMLSPLDFGFGHCF